MKFYKVFLTLFALALTLTALNFGCAGRTSKTPKPADPTSVTEIAVGVAGGVINATAALGTPAFFRSKAPTSLVAKVLKSINLMDNAYGWILSSGICPAIQNPDPTLNVMSAASTCTVTGNQLSFGLADCNYNGSIAVWGGTQYIILGATQSNTTVACAVPFPFQTNDHITRSFGPGTARVSLHSLVVLVDTSGILTGWQNPISVTGESIIYGANNSISVDGMHLAASDGNFVVWDYTVNTKTPMTVVSATGNVTAGVVTTQNNQTQDVATTNLAGLTFAPGCCWPTSGTVTTTFQFAKSPTETMTFASPCGTATLNGSPVVLEQCF